METFDNAKYLSCVITDMEDLMKTFEGGNMPECLDEEGVKTILKKKIIELTLMRYMDRK